MTYDNGFSIDELVQDGRKFINKIVPVNGKLVQYSMGPGILTWPTELKVEGERYRITVSCQIGRAAGDHLRIKPYLEEYLGHEIGIEVISNNYRITALKFGEDEFIVRR